MSRTMRTISLSSRSRAKLLHIEAPGCIINIHVGLSDVDGREVTRVSIDADGDRYSGEPQWWIDGEEGKKGLGVRIVRTCE